jgi:hypothetical protein
MKLRISSANIAYISGVDKTLGVQKSEETRGGQGMATGENGLHLFESA